MLKVKSPDTPILEVIRATEVVAIATAGPAVEILAADRRENLPAPQVHHRLGLTEAIQTSVRNVGLASC